MLSVCRMLKHQNRLKNTGPAEMCRKCLKVDSQPVSEG